MMMRERAVVVVLSVALVVSVVDPTLPTVQTGVMVTVCPVIWSVRAGRVSDDTVQTEG